MKGLYITELNQTKTDSKSSLSQTNRTNNFLEKFKEQTKQIGEGRNTSQPKQNYFKKKVMMIETAKDELVDYLIFKHQDLANIEQIDQHLVSKINKNLETHNKNLILLKKKKEEYERISLVLNQETNRSVVFSQKFLGIDYESLIEEKKIDFQQAEIDHASYMIVLSKERDKKYKIMSCVEGIRAEAQIVSKEYEKYRILHLEAEEAITKQRKLLADSKNFLTMFNMKALNDIEKKKKQYNDLEFALFQIKTHSLEGQIKLENIKDAKELIKKDLEQMKFNNKIIDNLNVSALVSYLKLMKENAEILESCSVHNFQDLVEQYLNSQLLNKSLSSQIDESSRTLFKLQTHFFELQEELKKIKTYLSMQDRLLSKNKEVAVSREELNKLESPRYLGVATNEMDRELNQEENIEIVDLKTHIKNLIRCNDSVREKVEEAEQLLTSVFRKSLHLRKSFLQKSFPDDLELFNLADYHIYDEIAKSNDCYSLYPDSRLNAGSKGSSLKKSRKILKFTTVLIKKVLSKSIEILSRSPDKEVTGRRHNNSFIDQSKLINSFNKSFIDSNKYEKFFLCKTERENIDFKSSNRFKIKILQSKNISYSSSVSRYNEVFHQQLWLVMYFEYAIRYEYCKIITRLAINIEQETDDKLDQLRDPEMTPIRPDKLKSSVIDIDSGPSSPYPYTNVNKKRMSYDFSLSRRLFRASRSVTNIKPIKIINIGNNELLCEYQKLYLAKVIALQNQLNFIKKTNNEIDKITMIKNLTQNGSTSIKQNKLISKLMSGMDVTKKAKKKKETVKNFIHNFLKNTPTPDMALYHKKVEKEVENFTNELVLKNQKVANVYPNVKDCYSRDSSRKYAEKVKEENEHIFNEIKEKRMNRATTKRDYTTYFKSDDVIDEANEHELSNQKDKGRRRNSMFGAKLGSVLIIDEKASNDDSSFEDSNNMEVEKAVKAKEKLTALSKIKTKEPPNFKGLKQHFYRQQDIHTLELNFKGENIYGDKNDFENKLRDKMKSIKKSLSTNAFGFAKGDSFIMTNANATQKSIAPIDNNSQGKFSKIKAKYALNINKTKSKDSNNDIRTSNTGSKDFRSTRKLKNDEINKDACMNKTSINTKNTRRDFIKRILNPSFLNFTNNDEDPQILDFIDKMKHKLQPTTIPDS